MMSVLVEEPYGFDEVARIAIPPRIVSPFSRATPEDGNSSTGTLNLKESSDIHESRSQTPGNLDVTETRTARRRRQSRPKKSGKFVLFSTSARGLSHQSMPLTKANLNLLSHSAAVPPHIIPPTLGSEKLERINQWHSGVTSALELSSISTDLPNNHHIPVNRCLPGKQGPLDEQRSPASPGKAPSSKMHPFRLTTQNLIASLLMSIFCFILYLICKPHHTTQAHRSEYLTAPVAYNVTVLPRAAFQPPEDIPHRRPDMIDTFADYKYREACGISSLDLHSAFAPLCYDRQSLLAAMSDGGRIGIEAPYIPRGCDMRWFTTNEVCEILSRFKKVIIVGDSMMRHVVGSMNVLLRKDLGHGAVTDWNFSPQERQDCFCNNQFDVKGCSIQGIFKTADVVKHDPDSLACPPNSLDVTIEMMIKYPLQPDEVARYRNLLSPTKPSKPYAFIFGHGLWNDLDLQATLNWLDEILAITTSAAPYLARSHARGSRNDRPPLFPRLIVTPNAAGLKKPDQWLMTQGNKALRLFEASIREEMEFRDGVEHLGTWNMSILANLYDGVHLDLKGNMVKAMMVLNWLSMVEVEEW